MPRILPFTALLLLATCQAPAFTSGLATSLTQPPQYRAPPVHTTCTQIANQFHCITQ